MCCWWRPASARSTSSTPLRRRGALALRPCGSRPGRRGTDGSQQIGHVNWDRAPKFSFEARLGGQAEDHPVAHLSGGPLTLLHHTGGRPQTQTGTGAAASGRRGPHSRSLDTLNSSRMKEHRVLGHPIERVDEKRDVGLAGEGVEKPRLIWLTTRV
jgi:hypothetical protein